MQDELCVSQHQVQYRDYPEGQELEHGRGISFVIEDRENYLLIKFLSEKDQDISHNEHSYQENEGRYRVNIVE